MNACVESQYYLSFIIYSFISYRLDYGNEDTYINDIAGYVLPKFTQVTVTSYYAASSASHYGISLLTRRIEEAKTSHSQHERIR